VASDIMAPVKDKAFAGMPLKDVIDQMHELNIDQIPRIVEYLFPFETMVEHGTEMSIGQLANFEAETVKDIMNESPSFVKKSAFLGDMAGILLQEKINELPVVDDDMRVVGQINIYEVIMSYLKEIHEK